MSCGDVCVYGGDYDPPDFTATKVVRARIQHRCSECGETILPGERYEQFRGVLDDYWYGTKTCLPCVEIRDALMCDGYVCGTVWESIQEQAYPEWLRTSPFECLAQLKTKAARDKLAADFERWRTEWLEDMAELEDEECDR